MFFTSYTIIWEQPYQLTKDTFLLFFSPNSYKTIYVQLNIICFKIIYNIPVLYFSTNLATVSSFKCWVIISFVVFSDPRFYSGHSFLAFLFFILSSTRKKSVYSLLVFLAFKKIIFSYGHKQFPTELIIMQWLLGIFIFEFWDNQPYWIVLLLN